MSTLSVRLLEMLPTEWGSLKKQKLYIFNMSWTVKRKKSSCTSYVGPKRSDIYQWAALGKRKEKKKVMGGSFLHRCASCHPPRSHIRSSLCFPACMLLWRFRHFFVLFLSGQKGQNWTMCKGECEAGTVFDSSVIGFCFIFLSQQAGWRWDVYMFSSYWPNQK